jgi:hypothetical protein
MAHLSADVAGLKVAQAKWGWLSHLQDQMGVVLTTPTAMGVVWPSLKLALPPLYFFFFFKKKNHKNYN